MESNSISLIEHTHVNKMAETLNRQLSESQKNDHGDSEGLRKQVLGDIVNANYDGAKEKILNYVGSKRDFLEFQRRSHRYVEHCIELIDAIQTKRNFPGFSSLALNKQQKIHEKVLGHFEEVKISLRQIAKIERDEKILDSRSTVWVLRSLSLVTFTVFVGWFLKDLYSGLLSSAVYMTEIGLEKFSNWLLAIFGF